MTDEQIDTIARKYADLMDQDDASSSPNEPTRMARVGGAVRETRLHFARLETLAAALRAECEAWRKRYNHLPLSGFIEATDAATAEYERNQ